MAIKPINSRMISSHQKPGSERFICRENKTSPDLYIRMDKYNALL
jgi:hypothetical protein